MNLPSRYQIGEKALVNFDFVELDTNSRTKAASAVIGAVKFAQGKVFYDLQLETAEGEAITYLVDIDSYFMQDIVEVTSEVLN